MNEAQTELILIDPALKKAGWGVVAGSHIKKQYPISQGRLQGIGGKRSTPLKADYILQYKNRNIAVIEGKSDKKEYTEGVGQAKNYAQRLHIRYSYSTNGIKIYEIDMDKGAENDISKFPTPDELWNKTFADIKTERDDENDWKEKMHAIPLASQGYWKPRYYQDNAITKVIDAIAQGRDRLLLTLATGTGKTAIAFQISWKLFNSKWNLNRDGKRLPRILFLADRNILADQAFNSFSAFEEDALIRIRPNEIKKKGHVPTNGSIFFTIFQTFMSGANNEPYFGEYPKDYFDLIIIDECHRGGANDESNWRAIMEYFNTAVQLGLTATPKRKDNIDTYRYFGNPLYIYSLKEGINDGFLTPFRVKQVQTTIDEYSYTPEDFIEAGEIEKGKVYTEAEMNRKIEIKDREEYRVKLLLAKINQNHKTLIFCATQKHALMIRDLINQHSDSSNTNYCHRVTADEGQIGEQHLRDFQDNEKIIPTILTTSQKLSTGVDAPEIRNIVLFRLVNSMIEFKQIIGRGTRLFDDKDYFTLYDFVGAHKHFNDPEWDGEPLEPDETTPSGARICEICGQKLCICAKPEAEPCTTCGYVDCRCNTDTKIIKIKLGDGKVRELDSMVKTSFLGPDGKPISSKQFLESIFGVIPELFKDEDELRVIWSKPDTRKKLLQDLDEKGFAQAQLKDLMLLINAKDSDLYDVLSYIAYATNPLKRQDRADMAKNHFNEYELSQRVFLDFILNQYIELGISELDDAKLPELLKLKYNAINDAQKKLGDIQSIRNIFIGFQKYLYSY